MTLHISKKVIYITSFIVCTFTLFSKSIISKKTENTFHKKLSRVFQKIKSKPLIEADLSYHLYSSFSEKVTTTSGKLLLKKPYFFKWDILKPEKELQIYNGDTLWKYLPSSMHAQCIPLTPQKIHFLEFFNDLKTLEKEFSLSQSSLKTFNTLSREKYSQITPLKESSKHDKIFLKLIPKKSQHTNDLYYFLYLDGKKGEIHEVFISKKNGNQLLFIFSHEKTLASLKDENAFVFKPKKGMIIDKCK